MKPNHILGLIVAYYLSRFDRNAYLALGFETQTTAHQAIGMRLGVKPNSIKNMRDEFDPLHANPRAGWYQRPLRPSRARVVELFQDTTEEELRDIVQHILSNSPAEAAEVLAAPIDTIAGSQGTKAKTPVYVVRGPTGRRAEQIYIDFHRSKQRPLPGNLVDHRDHGTGYDFEIQGQAGTHLVEVKGLDGDSGGILFTAKEWNVARKSGPTYYLVIVRNVFGDPTIQIINDPASILKPTQYVRTVVQLTWSVTDRQLILSPSAEPAGI
jgi:hypothetical protein